MAVKRSCPGSCPLASHLNSGVWPGAVPLVCHVPSHSGHLDLISSLVASILPDSLPPLKRKSSRAAPFPFPSFLRGLCGLCASPFPFARSRLGRSFPPSILFLPFCASSPPPRLAARLSPLCPLCSLCGYSPSPLPPPFHPPLFTFLFSLFTARTARPPRAKSSPPRTPPAPRRGSRRFLLQCKKFHAMEVKFAVFPRHGTQIVPVFHGMEPTFSKTSTP